MSASEDTGLAVELHGKGVTVEHAIEAAMATKKLLDEVARTTGIEGVEWQIKSIQFKCDGCDLRRADRPGRSEGWTHDGGNDYCPECSTARRSAS